MGTGDCGVMASLGGGARRVNASRLRTSGQTVAALSVLHALYSGPVATLPKFRQALLRLSLHRKQR